MNTIPSKYHLLIKKLNNQAILRYKERIIKVLLGERLIEESFSKTYNDGLETVIKIIKEE